VVTAALALRVGAKPIATAGRGTAKIGRRWIAAALVVASLAIAAAALSPGQDNGPLGTEIDHGRTEIWSAAVQTALERPWLGSGAETFELATAPQQQLTAVRYAHNLPLEAWVELGLAGLLLMLALYAAVGVAVWNARNSLAGGWLFGTGALVFLVSNLSDWTWHLAGMGAVWARCIGGTLVARPRPWAS
jgi:O-antigen ligase